MKKMKLLLACILMTTALFAQKTTTSSAPAHLNFQKAGKQEAPKLSTLLKDIRYVALETTDECLLSNAWDVVLTEKYIVYNDAQQCYVFDKATGKYLHKIGSRKDQGPQGYVHPTSPLCIIGNEVLMLDGKKEYYKVYSLDNGKLLRKIPGEGPFKETWTMYKVFPLKDSLLVQSPLNVEGKNDYRMNIRTLSGTSLKKYPSINNAKFDLGGYAMDTYEVDLYSYNDHVYFHECTSDTIYRINDQLELEPSYVIGLGNMLPTLDEIRGNLKMEEGEFIIFGKMMETNDWLLLSNSLWTENHYLYNKKTGKLNYINAKESKGFTNDLNGYLPFWPAHIGYGKAKNEICACIQAEEYLEGVETTGKNPLGKELNFDDNPVIVIGTLK